METVLLGKTGRTVSRLGFGGAPAGIPNYLGVYDPNAQRDREPFIAAIGRALELGINYFDTAASYGDGASERIYGEALAGTSPDDIFLATKMLTTAGANVRRQFEQSLKNLRRSSIDLIQIHSPSQPAEEMLFEKGGMLEELAKLKTEGLVRHIGFTMEEQSPMLYHLLDLELFSTLQIQYNVVFQHPYDPYFKTGSLYKAEEKGLGIITMRSLTSGILQRFIQAANPDNTFDYSPAILQFLLGNKLVDVALVGMRSAQEVERNVAIVADRAHRIDPDPLHARIVQ